MNRNFLAQPHWLIGISHGWEKWVELMRRSRDWSAPWDQEAARTVHECAWREQRIGASESSCATK